MLSEIVNGKGWVSPEIAVRIAKATNTSPESWLAVQNKLDLWNTMQNESKDVIKFGDSIAVNQ
jgi:antitoxin HigA-1